MKTKLLLIVALLFSASVGVFAIPIVGPCPADKYAVYLATPGFSCTIGDKTFSNFGYADSGSLDLEEDQIQVTPTSSGGEFGFNFEASWATSAGMTSDSQITYTVTAVPGFSISDAALSIQGFGVTSLGVGGTGFAQVSVADTLSNGANLFVFFNSACAPNNCVITDSTTFPGVQSLNVFKDVGLSSASAGTGALSFVSNTVSQTPEPASLALLGSSLLGLGYFMKKKKLFTA